MAALHGQLPGILAIVPLPTPIVSFRTHVFGDQSKDPELGQYANLLSPFLIDINNARNNSCPAIIRSGAQFIPMDKLDLVLIPLLYMFQMTLTLISVAIKFIPTPSKVGTEIRNATTWTAIISLHMILFVLSDLHRLTQITIIQIPLNMMEQLIIARTCLFCKFSITVSSNQTITDKQYGDS